LAWRNPTLPGVVDEAGNASAPATFVRDLR
jgi:hypothetical protein